MSIRVPIWGQAQAYIINSSDRLPINSNGTRENGREGFVNYSLPVYQLLFLYQKKNGDRRRTPEAEREAVITRQRLGQE